MKSYVITVEDLNDNICAKAIRQALEDADENTVVSVNVKKKLVTVDTDLPVEELFEIIEEAGYTPTDLELI